MNTFLLILICQFPFSDEPPPLSTQEEIQSLRQALAEESAKSTTRWTWLLILNAAGVAGVTGIAGAFWSQLKNQGKQVNPTTENKGLASDTASPLTFEIQAIGKKIESLSVEIRHLVPAIDTVEKSITSKLNKALEAAPQNPQKVNPRESVFNNDADRTFGKKIDKTNEQASFNTGASQTDTLETLSKELKELIQESIRKIKAEKTDAILELAQRRGLPKEQVAQLGTITELLCSVAAKQDEVHNRMENLTRWVSALTNDLPSTEDNINHLEYLAGNLQQTSKLMEKTLIEIYSIAGLVGEDYPIEVTAKKIEELPFDIRAFNAFKKAKITTLGEIIGLRKQGLMKVKHLGKGTVEKIAEVLLENEGIELKD